jgi:hypothetical protein
MSDFLSDFAASPARLGELFERVTVVGKLDVPRSEGKWTPRFIAHHLADVEVLHSMRFAAMLTNDNPAIVPIQQEALAALTEYEKRDPATSVQAYAALRTRNVALLRALSNAQLERVAVHPKYGEFTMSAWAEFVTKHDLNHFAQLEESLI